jgi:16S rRNA (cytosine1402-N4)-methyltransferase
VSAGVDKSTNPGPHKAVLRDEAIEALAVVSNGIYVDATFGRGGHSTAILRRLGPNGKLVALDRDPEAVAVGREVTDPRFVMIHSAFGRLRDVLEEIDVKQVNGVLLDLGVSSPQLDQVQRGFSFRRDGPLDMRMDNSRGQTAAQWIAQASQEDIEQVIRRYGEERFAKQIARAIVAARSRGPVDRTGQLAKIVAEAIPARDSHQDPATRTFQALRIYLNQELEELEIALPQCVDALSVGGRLVVISFHSLEDRIVKQFLRAQASADHLPRRLPVKAADLPLPILKLLGRAVRASEEETAANPRARSAVLRAAEKLAA